MPSLTPLKVLGPIPINKLSIIETQTQIKASMSRADRLNDCHDRGARA